MTQTIGQRIVLAARPDGKPRPGDFRLEQFDVPRPVVGQILLGVNYLSLDTYMRGRMDDRKSYAAPVPLGGVMQGETVATVLASKHPDYAEGDVVTAYVGWASHGLSDGSRVRKIDPQAGSVTTALGVLGMPGFTAYVGLLTIGQPKPGETVVVAAASGPVGSLVGQIARIKGARVVGIVGGAAKCAFAKNELGFDVVLDHRSDDLAGQLAASCPDGIDVYFENVGGAIWQAVLPLLNLYARVPVCGLIAQYNGSTGDALLAPTMREVLTRSLTIRGFINTEFADQREAFLRDVSGWLAAGQVRQREDIVDGLENAPAAFIGMLEGRNFGKLLVRVAA